MATIALVQYTNQHEEVLAPQIEMLKGFCRVEVFAPESIFETDLLRALSSEYNKNKVYAPKHLLIKIIRRLVPFFFAWTCYKKIRNKAADLAVSCVIFNTISSIYELCLIVFLFRKIPTIHIIHNMQHYAHMPRKHFLSYFKKNLFISKDVFDHTIRHCIREEEVHRYDHFLPILFDSFLSRKGTVGTIGGYTGKYSINTELINIGIVGSVDMKRRNYRCAVESVKKANSSAGRCLYRIYIISRISSRVRNYIYKSGMYDSFVYFNDHIPYAEMFHLIKRIDLLAFMADRSVKNNKYYNTYKITGTSVLAKAFKKPCISSDEFRIDGSLRDKTLFYHADRFDEVLRKINAGEITKNTIKELAEKFSAEGSFDQTFQKERYLSIIRSCISD
ncbi:hypothetical protein ACFL6D_00310 [Spirochaetota bacterium]